MLAREGVEIQASIGRDIAGLLRPGDDGKEAQGKERLDRLYRARKNKKEGKAAKEKKAISVGGEGEGGGG